MTTNPRLAFAAVLVSLSLCAAAATYSGNGNSSFLGPVGLGSLTLTDDGTTVSGTLNRGAGPFDGDLVLYIDSVPGGFADTSGFNDTGPFQRSISGVDFLNRSLLTFSGGMLPDYAISLSPIKFGGLLFKLANGGPGSMPFIANLNLDPVAPTSNYEYSPTYTFSFNVSQIGLTPNSGATFLMLGTLISDANRSDEAIAGNVAGTPGANPFVQTALASYTIVPEPSSLTLFGLALAGAFGLWRRK